MFPNSLLALRNKRLAIQKITEIARKNLGSNSELRKAESKFIKLEPSETAILHFNPERIKHVEGQFGVRVQYTTINPNYSDKGEKKFETGKLTSKQIDSLLLQGKTLDHATRRSQRDKLQRGSS